MLIDGKSNLPTPGRDFLGKVFKSAGAFAHPPPPFLWSQRGAAPPAIKSAMAVVRDNQQIVLHIEGDAMGIREFGCIAFEHTERGIVVGRCFSINNNGRRK